MITRERLEELIENNGTVYCVLDKVYKITLDKRYFCIIGDYLQWSKFLDKLMPQRTPHIDDIYEIKEDAEFIKEFKNITRTETLNLPTWEEIQYTKHYFIYKFSIKDNYDFFGRITILKDYNIKVSGLTQGVLFEEYFDEAASKENYIKACTIARKLFLGESIEEGENDEESKN